MSEKPNYKILAKSKEEFEKVEEKIKALPVQIQLQISQAEMHIMGDFVQCVCRKTNWDEPARICVPKDLHSLTKNKGKGFQVNAKNFIFYWGEEFDKTSVEFHFI